MDEKKLQNVNNGEQKNQEVLDDSKLALDENALSDVSGGSFIDKGKEKLSNWWSTKKLK